MLELTLRIDMERIGQQLAQLPRHAQVGIACDQRGFGAIAIKKLDARNKLSQLCLGFFELFLVFCV